MPKKENDSDIVTEKEITDKPRTKKPPKPTFKSVNSERHKNHRQNMRQKFLKFGIDCFEEHEILEILLYNCIPMKDTNPIAHDLLSKYGSIVSILDSDYKQLVESGLTPNCATFIKFIQQLATYYNYDKFYDNKHRLDENALRKKLIGLTERNSGEVLILGLYDLTLRELFLGVIDHGAKTGASVVIEKIIKLVYRFDASIVVIAHNHPSGLMFPSQDDIDMTNLLQAELSRIGVTLYNHYLISNNYCLPIIDVPE